jgi:hypothetical protein
VQSWQNSLRATAMVFQEAGLDDHGVLLEYRTSTELPSWATRS